MATTTFTISDETGNGISLEKLNAGIIARSQALRSWLPDSFVAAAITILRSLRASTSQVDKKVVETAAYTIEETNLWGGFMRQGGKARIVARVGGRFGHHDPSIRPAIGFKPGDRNVLNARIYKIATSNPFDTFEKNISGPGRFWYVLCQHVGQAQAYAENHVRRIYAKEGGMAKYAIGIAQAQASTRTRMKTLDEAIGSGGMSSRATTIAYGAAEINIETSGGASSGTTSVSFYDHLNYSKAAAGGETAVAAAINSAANSLIGAYGDENLKQFWKFHNNDTPTQISNELYKTLQASLLRRSGSANGRFR